jgi:diguanylate cyclase (GGDEF)-like protein
MKENVTMSELEEIAINLIIENKSIRTVFQPIVSLKDGHILGYEALSRMIDESHIKTTDELFTLAETTNRLWDLELVCRTKAIESGYKSFIYPNLKKLFLNVNPSIMQDKKFHEGFTKEFIKQFSIPSSNIIFEITERNVINDIKGFKDSIQHYKNQGFQIAIDDAGSGYAGLNLISDINPDYIKLDIGLIRDIDQDNLKYALVKSMVEFSRISNIKLIAEGIETKRECEVLIKLGVQYGQGYYIQKPNTKIEPELVDIQEIIEEMNRKINYGNQYGVSSTYISHLCSNTLTLQQDERAIDVYQHFKKNDSCMGFCVVKEEKPLGIVTRGDLALKLSGNYGFALFHNNRISDLMKSDFLSVDIKTPIELVSSMAMSRKMEDLYDFIVVTHENQYYGTVTVKDLLQKTTELEINSAKQQNPLTGLAGNQVIEQKIMMSIDKNNPYTIIYCDIDNFKAYNDIYGFENGDLIIKMLANIIREYITFNDFVGHIGGDDFIVILDRYVEDTYYLELIKLFDKNVQSYYNSSDLERSYILTTNRKGKEEKFPLITLTCVMVNNLNVSFPNQYEISKELARLKKNEKNRKLLNRRIK